MKNNNWNSSQSLPFLDIIIFTAMGIAQTRWDRSHKSESFQMNSDTVKLIFLNHDTP